MLSRASDSDETPPRVNVRVTQTLVTEFGPGVKELGMTRSVLQAKQQQIRKTKL